MSYFDMYFVLFSFSLFLFWEYLILLEQVHKFLVGSDNYTKITMIQITCYWREISSNSIK